MTPTLYTNARLIDPSLERDEPGALLVEDGLIKAVGSALEAPAGAKIVNCGGRILCPGFTDMRAHAVDVAAATAGGITTIVADASNCLGVKTVAQTAARAPPIRQARPIACQWRIRKYTSSTRPAESCVRATGNAAPPRGTTTGAENSESDRSCATVSYLAF